MNIIQLTADLVRPWCSTDPERPNLLRPWVQIVGDRFAVCASDGIAAAWVAVTQRPAKCGAILWGQETPDPALVPPDLEKVIPPALWPVDCLPLILQAREATRGVRLNKAARAHAVVSTSPNMAVLHGKGVDVATHEAQAALDGASDIMHLSADHVSRLPVTFSAVRYGPAIMMTHPHGVCSVLMARRAW
jgi:hypothetical protein